LTRKLVYSRFQPSRVLRDDEGAMLTCACFWSQNEKLIVGTHDGQVQVYSVETANMLESWECHGKLISCFSFIFFLFFLSFCDFFCLLCFFFIFFLSCFFFFRFFCLSLIFFFFSSLFFFFSFFLSFLSFSSFFISFFF